MDIEVTNETNGPFLLLSYPLWSNQSQMRPMVLEYESVQNYPIFMIELSGFIFQHHGSHLGIPLSAPMLLQGSVGELQLAIATPEAPAELQAGDWLIAYEIMDMFVVRLKAIGIWENHRKTLGNNRNMLL